MLIRDTEKTIPYRLSPAEIANLRVLRNKINPSSSSQDVDDEEETTEKINSRNSDPYPWLSSQKVKKNSP